MNFSNIATVTQVPVVAAFLASLASDPISPADAMSNPWVALFERFGFPVVAAAASAWVAYKVARAALDRAWGREDSQDQLKITRDEKWEALTKENITALTKVNDTLTQVCESIKTCRNGK